MRPIIIDIGVALSVRESQVHLRRYGSRPDSLPTLQPDVTPSKIWTKISMRLYCKDKTQYLFTLWVSRILPFTYAEQSTHGQYITKYKNNPNLSESTTVLCKKERTKFDRFVGLYPDPRIYSIIELFQKYNNDPCIRHVNRNYCP